MNQLSSCPQATWSQVGFLAKLAIQEQLQYLRSRLEHNTQFDAQQWMAKHQPTQNGRYLMVRTEHNSYVQPQQEFPSSTVRNNAQFWAYVRIKDNQMHIIGQGGKQ